MARFRFHTIPQATSRHGTVCRRIWSRILLWWRLWQQERPNKAMRSEREPGRIWAIICGAGFLALVAIQFIRPAIPHPPATADLAAPPEVKQILKTSCYDCHSNQTTLAWFDKIAPAYWLVASDV